MPPLRGAEHCWAHHPQRTKERDAARRRGGKNRRRSYYDGDPTPVSLRTPEDVLELLNTAIMDTMVLENSISRSRTLAYLASQSLRAIEVHQLEERLKNIEARLAAGGGAWGG